MASDIPTHGLELISRITRNGRLALSLEEATIPALGDDDVLVRVEASPLNPSDIGLLIGPAQWATGRRGGTAERPTFTADVPSALLRNVAGRLDESMRVGNEGAGTVIDAGRAARDLLGRTVAMSGGAMYSQYRVLPRHDTMVLPADARAADGASCFINPLTALAMVETMRREGHRAIVHTAAASNLGQMLHRICLKDGVPLVNIVRSQEQVATLKEMGAEHVVDSSSEDFPEALAMAIETTGATIAFDAIGGGTLVSRILVAMEAALARKLPYSRYGSPTHKQAYLYGRLDPSPLEVTGQFGMAWGMGGFLLAPVLHKIGDEGAQRLRERVLAELTTTFASAYAAEISLADVLDPVVMAAYCRRATGRKYLVNPARV